MKLLKGKILPESWEKQSVYRLSNGFKVTVGYSFYGEMVQRIDSPDGKIYWHCSDGHLSADRKDFNQTPADGDWNKFPQELEFARDWIEPIAPGHWQTIMVPKFERA